MATFILTAAIRAVKSRIGTWRAYDQITDLVPEISREQWASAIGEARAALAQRVSEVTRPLNRIPTADEFGPTIERRSSAKYWQTVEVYVRDKVTGARSVMHFTARTDTLRSRLAVVGSALDFVNGIIDADPDTYQVDVAGFAYTGTYQITAPR